MLVFKKVLEICRRVHGWLLFKKLLNGKINCFTALQQHCINHFRVTKLNVKFKIQILDSDTVYICVSLRVFESQNIIKPTAAKTISI